MSTNYYSKSEVDALLAAKANLSSAVDIEITDSAKGLILQTAGATRTRGTLVTDGTKQTIKVDEL